MVGPGCRGRRRRSEVRVAIGKLDRWVLRVWTGVLFLGDLVVGDFRLSAASCAEEAGKEKKDGNQLQPPVATSEPDQSRLKLQLKVQYFALLEVPKDRLKIRIHIEVSG